MIQSSVFESNHLGQKLFLTAALAQWPFSIKMICWIHRHLRKVDCSRYISWQKNSLWQEQALVAGTKKQAAWLGSLAGWIDVPALTGNIFIVITNSTNRTKQARLARPLIFPPKIRYLTVAFFNKDDMLDP